MKHLILILCVVTAAAAHAQRFSIQGQLRDTLDNPLPSPTVLLLNPSDSSLVNFAVGDNVGNFVIRNVKPGEHLIKVTFLGFRTVTRKVTTPTEGEVVDLGVITMEPATNELGEIEITGERAPVVIKNDTIEFNASSFKTQPNAMVEDLLKKLPGVEVDNEGNITAQGERVQRVTVDGKNFFGNDPKLATRNLPADAVDKVQFFDKKSDQAAFSGIDDGQREKTINLGLKEEKRNGAFGTLMAGVGNDDRFTGRASLNRFTKTRQISLLGMGNNVNEQGFSMNDYLNFMGGAQQFMSGGGTMRISIKRDASIPLNLGGRANGIMSNYGGGLNLNNSFSKDSELNGSYFYNYLDHARNQSTVRDNFLPSGTFTYREESRQQNTNDNHRLNLAMEHSIDSANSLKFSANASHNQTRSDVTSESQNINDDGILNESERRVISDGINKNLNSNLLWRHRFSKKGRTLSANLSFGLVESTRDGMLDATNHFYGDDPTQETLRQEHLQSNDARRYGASASYTEPLGGRKYLETNYNFQRNISDAERLVYDVNADLRNLNESLTNRYKSDYQYHRAGLNFRLNRDRYNLVVGGSLQRTQLHGDLPLMDVEIDRSFENVLPSVRLNIDFSSTKHLTIGYETSVQEPDIRQLQPIVDNSDPLNLYVGNPDLRPAYNQSWNVDFTMFNPANFVSVFAFLRAEYVTNAITQAQTIGQNLVRTTMPVNVDNNMSVDGNATLSFPVNAIKSRLTFSANYRNGRSINLLNDIATTINEQTAGGTVRYTFRYKDAFDLSLTADLDHQLTDYAFDQPSQVFINGTYGGQASLQFLKRFQFVGNFDYLTYRNDGLGFSQEIPLLNLAVSAFMLKNKSGELKFSVNNVLDKALGVTQTASINYLERQTINSLGRYFMVSFTYAINKQLNAASIRGGGFHIIKSR